MLGLHMVRLSSFFSLGNHDGIIGVDIFSMEEIARVQADALEH